MRTQFVMVDMIVIDGHLMTEVAPAKIIKCGDGLIPEHIYCAWCGSPSMQPKMDITQRSFYGNDKMWTVLLCGVCLQATVLSYELIATEPPCL